MADCNRGHEDCYAAQDNEVRITVHRLPTDIFFPLVICSQKRKRFCTTYKYPYMCTSLSINKN